MSTSSFLLRKRTGARPARVDRRALADLPAPPSLRAALAGGTNVAVIAEFKRRSPSAGVLIHAEVVDDVVTSYAGHGATGISLLTDFDDFGGSFADLRTAAALDARLPLLCKDFVTDVAQIHEARAAGAAAVLLIAALLDDDELARLVVAVREAGMESLLEVHDEAELERALRVTPDMLGINNRNLHTLTTDLAATERLARCVPAGTIVVSESGIRTCADVARMRDAGAHAVLVGESLLRAGSERRGSMLRELASVPR